MPDWGQVRILTFHFYKYKGRFLTFSHPLLLYLPECFSYYFSFIFSSFCILFFPCSVLLFSSFCFHLNPKEINQTLKSWEPDQLFLDVFRGLTSQLPTVLTLYPVSLSLFFCCCISLNICWLEQGWRKDLKTMNTTYSFYSTVRAEMQHQ